MNNGQKIVVATIIFLIHFPVSFFASTEIAGFASCDGAFDCMFLKIIKILNLAALIFYILFLVDKKRMIYFWLLSSVPVVIVLITIIYHGVK